MDRIRGPDGPWEAGQAYCRTPLSSKCNAAPIGPSQTRSGFFRWFDPTFSTRRSAIDHCQNHRHGIRATKNG